MSIGAEIVTFNPDVTKLKMNIERVVSQVNQLVLVDNGSNNVDEVRQLVREFNIKLIEFNENKGIAAALNAGMEFFENQGMTWVITLDQDSVLPDNAVLGFKSVEQFDEPDTGILASQYDDLNWNESVRKEKLVDTTSAPIEKDMVITSGNMVRISAWRRAGRFDEWLFIDQVDFDFNARMRLVGYKIWQVNSVLMSHEIGAAVKNGVFARMLLYKPGASLMQHSPFREYYMQRNTIVFEKRYPEFKKEKRPLWLFSFINLRHVFLSDKPFAGFVAGLRGIIDGLRYSPENDNFINNFRGTVLNSSSKV